MNASPQKKDALVKYRQSLESGKQLFQEGEDNPTGFYVLEKGRIDIFVGNMKVASVEPRKGESEFIGEIAAMTHTRRTATAVTATLCSVLWIPIKDLDQVFGDFPHLANRLVQSLCTKLIHSNKVHAAEHQRSEIAGSKKLLLEYMRGVLHLMEMAARLCPGKETKDLLKYFVDTNPWHIEQGDPTKLFHLKIDID